MPRRPRDADAEAGADPNAETTPAKPRRAPVSLFHSEPLTELEFNVVADDAETTEPLADVPPRRLRARARSGTAITNNKAAAKAPRKAEAKRRGVAGAANDASADAPSAAPENSAPSSGVAHDNVDAAVSKATAATSSSAAHAAPGAPGRVRFAEKERPASAAAGRTRPGPPVLKSPGSRVRQPPAQPAAPPPEPHLLAPTAHLNDADILRLIAEAEDPRLDEELTTDVVGLLSPVQRERYYSRPAISSRMRISEYQKHRLNWAHPLRLVDAPRWDSSKQPVSESDFHADRVKALGPQHERRRTSALRRFHTGKAIAGYRHVVGKPTLPIKEMRKPWNQVTRPASFQAATTTVKGARRSYGYGTTPVPVGGYDMGRTLTHADALALRFDRNEQNARLAAHREKRTSNARRRAYEARVAAAAALPIRRPAVSGSNGGRKRVGNAAQQQRPASAGGRARGVGSARARAKARAAAAAGSGKGRQQRPASAGVVRIGSVISRRISRRPGAVANDVVSRFVVDQGRRGGAIQRHGKYRASGRRPRTGGSSGGGS